MAVTEKEIARETTPGQQEGRGGEAPQRNVVPLISTIVFDGRSTAALDAQTGRAVPSGPPRRWLGH